MPKNKIRTMTSIAMLTAISVVLARLLALFYTGEIRLSLGNIPVMFAGIFFGPLAGGICGLLADFIGCLIKGEAYFIPLALSPFLVGFIPGMVAKTASRKTKKGISGVFTLGTTIIITNILTAILWSTYALSLLIGKGFFILLPGRAFETALQTIIEIIILYILLNNATVRTFFGMQKTGGKKP